MRSVARLKMGYYPLPEAEGVKLRSLLSYTRPASVIDPCVGQGTALHLVTSDAQIRRYGVELDAERARIEEGLHSRILGLPEKNGPIVWARFAVSASLLPAPTTAGLIGSGQPVS